jgi:hypothetical protein
VLRLHSLLNDFENIIHIPIHACIFIHTCNYENIKYLVTLIEITLQNAATYAH